MPAPLVSCLVVSRPERLHLVTGAVRSYLAQTWAPRELVVVWSRLDVTEAAVKGSLGLADRPDVRIVLVHPDTTLGACRNASIAAARGDLVCQWDDDDLYHPLRLQRQVEWLAAHPSAAACFLGDIVVQDLRGERAWAADHLRAADPIGQLMHGSILLKRAHRVQYPEVGPTSIRGEDTVVVRQLMRARVTTVLRGEPWLYVYRYHGTNTVTALHAARMAAFLAAPPKEGTGAAFEVLASAVGGPSWDDLRPLDEALAWYREVLAAMPSGSPERIRHEAWECVRAGDLDRARTLLERLVAGGRPELATLVTLAGLYQTAGVLGRARSVLGPALEAWGNDPSAVAALGSLAIAEGRFDEAIRRFDEARDLAPWDPVILNDRGVVLARLGRTAEAVVAFREVLEVDPARASAHDNLCALLGSGRARVKAYEELARKHADVAEVIERYAGVLASVGAKARAREVRQRAMSLRTRSG